MGVGSGEQGDRASPWIFIHSIDKVEGGLLMVLFLVLSFPLPPPENFSAVTLGSMF